jgi:hypothetical protein
MNTLENTITAMSLFVCILAVVIVALLARDGFRVNYVNSMGIEVNYIAWERVAMFGFSIFLFLFNLIRLMSLF